MMVFEGSELVGFLFKAFAIVLLSGILALVLVPVRIKPAVSIITVFLVSFLTGFIAVKSFTAGEVEFLINGGTFFGTIPLRIDALSAWFILIINFTCVTGVLYGAGYLKSSVIHSSVLTLHWILYVIFHTSMLVVCMVQHSIAFIVAWEIMSLSSLFLVLFDYTNPKVLKAGLNYLVQMHLSVILITVGFIWVYFKTGTFDFKGASTFFGLGVNIWLFLIFFAGFGIKSGFLGLHTWLPQAHPAAPSHVSGVMSGVIVKMGIYGIFRIISYLRTDYLILGEIVLTFSLLTGLFGIINAAVHRDFKKMLAYCTIENIGIIGIGIGLGLIGIAKGQSLLCFLGFGGALLHVLNHSLFKSLLFFSAGSVYIQTHTRDMDKLGGIIKQMPKTAIMFLIGAVAIGGIPPLNGFISEFLIYCGLLQGINSAGISQITLMILSFAGLSIIGGISILTFTKTFGTIFLGTPRQILKHEPVEVSFLMLLPQYIIICAMVIIAVFPGSFLNMLSTVLNVNTFPYLSFNLPDLQGYVGIMKNISLASFIFVTVTGVVFFIRYILIKGKEANYASTWGCGYLAPNARMQYTGKSFSKSFGKLLNFIIIEKKGYTEIERNETFPVARKYRSFYLDSIDNKIIDPIMFQITSFINRFQFIQNGKIQAYVIYGIVFILAVFIVTVLNLWT
jgi:hydrogenase-4 component B